MSFALLIKISYSFGAGALIGLLDGIGFWISMRLYFKKAPSKGRITGIIVLELIRLAGLLTVMVVLFRMGLIQYGWFMVATAAFLSFGSKIAIAFKNFS